MKTYEVRFRQFKKGRRSIKVVRVTANGANEAKRSFGLAILTGRLLKDPSVRHAQLISVFPAKEA